MKAIGILFIAFASIASAQSVTQQMWTLGDTGPYSDWLEDIVVDKSGNIYITCTLEDETMIVTAKLSPDLDPLWIVPRRMTNGNVASVRLAQDSMNVYVAASAGSFSNRNIVVYRHSKGSGSGTSRSYGNPRNTGDYATDIAVDPNGNVVVVGTSHFNADTVESIVLKYNSNLGLVWGKTYLDTININRNFNRVAVDTAGNVYVTGPRTTKFSPEGDHKWTRVGADRIVLDKSGRPITAGREAPYWMIDKYDTNGIDMWGMAYDGGGTMGALSEMTVDTLDNVYITGGANWPLDWHTVKVTPGGNDEWGKTLAGPGGLSDYSYDVAADHDGNVYVTGMVAESGGENFFSMVTVRYDSTGKEVWRQTIGSGNNQDEYGACITVDDSNSVLVGGFRSFVDDLDRYNGELVVWKYRQKDRFRANPDGWQFRNSEIPMWDPTWWVQFDYSPPAYPALWSHWPVDAHSYDWPDWPLFVSTFGEFQCYFNPLPGARVYNPVAVRFWRMIADGGKYKDNNGDQHHWRGSCYGFAVSSLLFYNDFLKVSDRFPGYNQTYDVPFSPESMNMAHKYQLYQWGVVQTEASRGADKRWLMTEYQKLRKMLLTEKRTDRTLDIYSNNGSGAHSVVPCSVVTAGPDLDWLFVYDSNDPGNERIIEIRTDQWTWDYNMFPTWGGSQGFRLGPPLDMQLSYPILPNPGIVLPIIALYSTPNAATIISNPQGERLGYQPAGDILIDSMQNADPIIPLTGTESPPIGYTLPENTYRIEVSGLQDSSFSISLLSDSSCFTVSRSGCASDEADILTTEPGLRSIGYSNVDTSTKRIVLEGISSLPGSAMLCQISNLTVAVEDSIGLGIVDRSAFTISNHGRQKTYDLRLEYSFEPGYRVFEHNQLTIDSLTSHWIAPDWEHMEDGPLPILIDWNGDGAPDDTIVVQNEFVTGTHDETYDLVPDDFFLDQNYPNPFNASTTIRFGLPERSQVTMVVYNLLGQEVVCLVDEIREAGRSSVVWDAGALPSGLYLCRLDGASTRNPERRFVRTIKLMLVK